MAKLSGTTLRPRAAKSPKSPSKPRLEGLSLWGFHAVQEAWLNPARRCLSLRLTDSAFKSFQPIIEKAEAQGLSRPAPLRVARGDIDMFVPRETVHQGILLEVEGLPAQSLDDFLACAPSDARILILDQVTDPHNVGAILRSVAAFGADALIVTERHAPGATGVLAKTACGAVEHVPLIAVVNLARSLEALRTEGFWCIGLAEEGARDLSFSRLEKGRVALVLGAEGDGLRRLTRQHCDELVRLPTGGAIGSLNVSNAAAVALYEVQRQRILA
ncbi:MAG: 23S rRNA (guanosine(2251)-2'-O)-methyltransferase RlmB [Bdellovibrionales bacterium]